MFDVLEPVSKSVFEQKMHIFWCCEDLSKKLLQSSILQPLLLCEERIVWREWRGDIAQTAPARKRSEMIEEILELVTLGDGEQTVESDGVVGAALGTIRREVERVSPVSLKEGNSSRK